MVLRKRNGRVVILLGWGLGERESGEDGHLSGGGG